MAAVHGLVQVPARRWPHSLPHPPRQAQTALNSMSLNRWRRPAPRAGPPLAHTECAANQGSVHPCVLLCSVSTHAGYFPLPCPTAPFRDFALALVLTRNSHSLIFQMASLSSGLVSKSLELDTNNPTSTFLRSSRLCNYALPFLRTCGAFYLALNCKSKMRTPGGSGVHKGIFWAGIGGGVGIGGPAPRVAGPGAAGATVSGSVRAVRLQRGKIAGLAAAGCGGPRRSGCGESDGRVRCGSRAEGAGKSSGAAGVHLPQAGDPCMVREDSSPWLEGS